MDIPHKIWIYHIKYGYTRSSGQDFSTASSSAFKMWDGEIDDYEDEGFGFDEDLFDDFGFRPGDEFDGWQDEDPDRDGTFHDGKTHNHAWETNFIERRASFGGFGFSPSYKERVLEEGILLDTIYYFGDECLDVKSRFYTYYEDLVNVFLRYFHLDSVFECHEKWKAERQAEQEALHKEERRLTKIKKHRGAKNRRRVHNDLNADNDVDGLDPVVVETGAADGSFSGFITTHSASSEAYTGTTAIQVPTYVAASVSNVFSSVI